MSDEHLELAALLVRTFEAVRGDLTSLVEPEASDDLWPDDMRAAMEELIALRATLKRASELMPQHRQTLIDLFRKERAAANWDAPGFPVAPLLPETIASLDYTVEVVRREQLLDAHFDLRCKEPGPTLPGHYDEVRYVRR